MEQFTPEQPTTAKADSKVLGASLGTTLADAEKSAVFYKALGFEFRLGNAFNGDNAVGMALVDAEGGQLRASGLTIPGPKTPIFCCEFRGLEQPALQRSVRDPGASAITLQVHDADAAIQSAKATGGSLRPVRDTTRRRYKGIFGPSVLPQCDRLNLRIAGSNYTGLTMNDQQSSKPRTERRSQSFTRCFSTLMSPQPGTQRKSSRQTSISPQDWRSRGSRANAPLHCWPKRVHHGEHYHESERTQWIRDIIQRSSGHGPWNELRRRPARPREIDRSRSGAVPPGLVCRVKANELFCYSHLPRLRQSQPHSCGVLSRTQADAAFAKASSATERATPCG